MRITRGSFALCYCSVDSKVPCLLRSLAFLAAIEHTFNAELAASSPLTALCTLYTHTAEAGSGLVVNSCSGQFEVISVGFFNDFFNSWHIAVLACIPHTSFN